MRTGSKPRKKTIKKRGGGRTEGFQLEQTLRKLAWGGAESKSEPGALRITTETPVGGEGGVTPALVPTEGQGMGLMLLLPY